MMATGFFMIDNSVLDLLPTIKPTGFAVYSYLCRCADASGECFPNAETIGEAVGIGERQLRTVLATLEAAGLIKRRKRQNHLLFTVLPPSNNRQSIAECKETSGNLLPKHTGNSFPERKSIAEESEINCRANKDEQDPINKTTTNARDEPSIASRGLAPLCSGDDLTKNDLLQITMGFNGSVPGSTWDQAIRTAVATVLSRGAIVTRSDLLRIARERGDKPPSPGKDRLFLEDLTASICEAFRRQPETRTQTLPDLYAGQPKTPEEHRARRRAENAKLARLMGAPV